MSVQTLSIAPINDTDGHFRAWGSAISTAIAAVGLVQTADTGQINWTTVTHPTTTAYMGYEIWRFSDATQSTSPVFLRLDYGGDGPSGQSPQIGLTIGTASNGSGTITANGSFPGSTLAQRKLFIAGILWSSASASNFYVDSDGGSSLLLAGWVEASGSGQPHYAGMVNVVERTRNWDGTVNGQGTIVMVMFPSGSVNLGNSRRQMLVITNAATFPQGTTISGLPILSGGSDIASTNNTATVGSTVYTYPAFTGWTPQLHAPSKHLVGVWAFSDATANQQFALTTYGSSHTWNAFGPYGGSGDYATSGSMSCAWKIT